MTNPRRRKHGSSSLLLTERILIYAMGMGLLLLPVRAHALQPLAEFLHHAAELNFDNREARATAVQRVHEATQAWGHLLPALTMQADYIRNQYLGAANIPTGAAPGSNGVLPTHHVVMSPVDQWDLTFSAALPLIDVAAWNNVGAGAANQEAQRERMAATALEVQKTVARTYYQLVGARAVARAARRTLAAAEDNSRYLETRSHAGLASELDFKRALAEIERDHQAIEDADYSTVTLSRTLGTLTGLVPEGDPIQDPTGLPLDDLHDEIPLDQWTASVDGLPSVRAAVYDKRAAKRVAAGAQAALYPAVSAQFTERATNAFGFGQSPYYAVELLASWKLDLGNFESSRAQQAAAAAAAIRSERARATAADALADAWHQVRTQTAKSRSARTALDTSRLAASVAHEKYGSGKATLLDVVQAERDTFSAEVTDIQAEADLASARAVLRLCAGRSLVTP